jgi:solute carrier family 25 2-oxodicarboxylate transporter 21
MSTDWKNHFLSGGVAGAIECIALHPIDVAKTRQQLQITYRQSVSEIIKTIIQEGGGKSFYGFLRIYRGVLSPLLGMIPKSAVWLATNERVKYWMIGKDGKETSGIRLMAGFFSGWPEAVVITPFDTIKVKLQSRRFSSQYQNSWDCMRGVVSQEGIFGLWRGLETTLWRNGIWNGIYFFIIGGIRDWYNQKYGKEESRAALMIRNFCFGCTAGLVATSINTPLDLAKSRIQLGVHDQKYRWSFQTIVVVAREEGIMKLWRGLPLRLVRMGIGGGITICIYELMMSILRHKNF